MAPGWRRPNSGFSPEPTASRGCLLGNGERTGNVDLVTVALNLYTQGVDPGLDFSDIDAVVKTVEYCTNIATHPRQPYAGDLVFTAFSGSHQDAIKKGFAAQAARNDALWEVPYLPIDPARSGAQLRSRHPRQFAKRQGRRRLGARTGQGAETAQAAAGRLQPATSSVWRTRPAANWVPPISGPRSRVPIFSPDASCSAITMKRAGRGGDRLFVGNLVIDGSPHSVSGRGNGLISSVVAALAEQGIVLDVIDYTEHTLGLGSDAQAAAYVECRTAAGAVVWGVGIDADIATASVRAVLGAANAAG